MTDLNLQQIIELNSSLTQQEKHFQKLGVYYRISAAAWLLVVFAGFGIALLNTGIPPSTFTLIIVLTGYAGVLGMLMLWNMDSGVNHRLLSSVFNEGLKLEQEFPQLPQVRHNMVALHSGRGWQQRVNWFYSLPTMAVLAFATFNMQYLMGIDGWREVALWLATLFIYSSFSFYIRNETAVGMKRKVK